MNNVLHLKGQFQYQSNLSAFGPPHLPVGKEVLSDHLKNMQQQLTDVLRYWETDTVISGALVSVYYRHVVAKSNRIKGLLCRGSADPNDFIRGARFNGEDSAIRHVFTYYVSLDILRESIQRLAICENYVSKKYNGTVTADDIEAINQGTAEYKCKDISKTNFVKIITDAHYVQMFTIDRKEDLDEETAIVTIFKTDVKTTDLFNKLGIRMIDAKVIDETTVRLDPAELKLLKNRAPYLIAMKTRDLSQIVPEEISACDSSTTYIPDPEQEPIVGVIDTPFYEDVYFKEWVQYNHRIHESIDTNSQDCRHGTEVTSIIVDGPTINPDLDDGCGRFRVRHFGVATGGRFSSFTVLKEIRNIVATNQDIKVWNLSLGSIIPINRNFISPEAAELDKIQCENDVIFVIAGTNKPANISSEMRIGAPADSLNSIVVNAVNSKREAASYHRVGPVLSFFNKPDVSYYGGDYDQKIRVCTPFGEGFVSGTSFAAPWIARKMAYLIHIMGFTREVAKALLIDSAAGWNRRDDVSHAIGYGVVPKRIENIVQSPSDEIRFIMTGSTDAYETYTYNIPVPISKDKQPFFARATLCYFPKCSRHQGVDYTSTEMDIHFGRIREKSGKASIASINENRQSDDGFVLTREEHARKLYRKWDNVKLISDVIKNRSRPRKLYGLGMWGLSIKTKERLRSQNGRGLQFGVVVTLKEMYGENRIDDFIKLCMMRGWIVSQIDVNIRFDIYSEAEKNITFE